VDDFTALLCSVLCPGQGFKTGTGRCAEGQGSSVARGFCVLHDVPQRLLTPLPLS